MNKKIRNAGFLTAGFMAATLGFLGIAAPAHAEIRNYKFDITEKTVNYTGKNITALAVGGTIPGPVIEATVGDTLRTTFCNKLDEESSVHWHGILLPNDQDGVPHLNTKPIATRKCHTFEFPIKHHGTYWYHSHSNMQEQRGVYGAIVLHPKDGEREWAAKDHTLVLSDWTDESPSDVMRNLKRDSDYYALKKGSVQSWDRVIANGMPAIKNRLKNSWGRMGPMDIADVGYDAFLANGQKTHTLSDIHHGDKVRLRVVNAAASSYFNLQFAGGPMSVVAADGVDIEPLQLNSLRIGMAETYDVIVSMPHDGRAYELRATSMDGSGYSSTILGGGKDIVKAPDMPKPNLFVQDHSAHGGHAMPQPEQKMDHSAHAGHTSEPQGPVRDMKEYEHLRAVQPTTYDIARKQRDVRLELTGNMIGYTWSFDNKTLSEADKIKIKKGEVVRFTLVNTTMMNHPLHLHGHFFRVLNGQDDYSPLKHTVNLPPHETVTIEFAADEEKDWLFHCHNLYHMMSGMTRIVSYEDTPDNPHAKHMSHGSEWNAYGEITALSNMTSGVFTLKDMRNQLRLELDADYKGHYHVEPTYERAQWGPLGVRFFTGADFKNIPAEKHNLFVAGVRYILPLMIEAELRMDHTGHPRLQLGSELDLTPRLGFQWQANSNQEWAARLNYYPLDNKNLAISAGYDSRFRDPDDKQSPLNGAFGIGLKFQF